MTAQSTLSDTFISFQSVFTKIFWLVMSMCWDLWLHKIGSILLASHLHESYKEELYLFASPVAAVSMSNWWSAGISQYSFNCFSSLGSLFDYATFYASSNNNHPRNAIWNLNRCCLEYVTMTITRQHSCKCWLIRFIQKIPAA